MALTFLRTLLCERLRREDPRHNDFPGRMILSADPDDEARAEADAAAYRLYGVVLEGELCASRGLRAWQWVLADIVWLSWKSHRLFFELVRSAGGRADCRKTLHVAKAASLKMTDERAAEDVQQYLRDAQRSRRHKDITVQALFYHQLTSGTADSRAPGRVARIDSKKLVANAFLEKRRSLRGAFVPRPKRWPRQLNRICRPGQHFRSPQVPGYFHSCSATAWLQTYADLQLKSRRVRPDAAWPSRVLREGSVLRRQQHPAERPSLMWVVATSQWSCWTLDVDHDQEAGVFVPQTRPGSLHRFFAFAPDDLTVCSVASVSVEGRFLALQQDGDFMTIWRDAFLHRFDWKKEGRVAHTKGCLVSPRPFFK